MTKWFLWFFLLFIPFVGAEKLDFVNLDLNQPRIVISTKKITFPDYPNAYNPSFVKTDQGILMTFRHLPDQKNLHISHIYIVKLDEAFQPTSEPQLLDTRAFKKTSVPHQSEDARIFSYCGGIYIVYNDNEEVIAPLATQRRDMFIAQVIEEAGKFVLTKPRKLYHYQNYQAQTWQKNWSPFEYKDALLFSYSQYPHEVIQADLETGFCTQIESTPFRHDWNLGDLRGGTPALLVDGEYLSFFHSQIRTRSPVSKGTDRHHYFMGAYTFASEPPFNISRYTPSPIIGKNFYTDSEADKRVIFPGGFFVEGPYLYLTYGKDDREIWVAVIDKKKLMAFLKPAL